MDANNKGIVHTGTSLSCPDTLGARYPFTTFLHQGRREKVFISDIETRGVRIERPWTIVNFEPNSQNSDHPLVVRMAHVDGTAREAVHAKYLFSGEGANLLTRKQLNIKVSYREPAASLRGVIDGTVRSHFPDIKVSSVKMFQSFSIAYQTRCHVPSTTRMNPQCHTKGERHGLPLRSTLC